MGELRRHRGRLHRLPRRGRRGFASSLSLSPRSSGAATSSSSATRSPTGTCACSCTGSGGATGSATARGRSCPARGGSSASSGASAGVDVLESPLDDYVEALERRAGGDRARERPARRARTRGSRRSRTPSSTRCSSSAASATRDHRREPPGLAAHRPLRRERRGQELAARAPASRATSGRSRADRGGRLRAWRTTRQRRCEAARGGGRRRARRLAGGDPRALRGLAGGEIFLVLDQFEEYFLYHGAGEDAEDVPRRASREAVAAPGLRANFLISIREDALAKLDRFKGADPEPARATTCGSSTSTGPRRARRSWARSSAFNELLGRARPGRRSSRSSSRPCSTSRGRDASSSGRAAGRGAAEDRAAGGSRRRSCSS